MQIVRDNQRRQVGVPVHSANDVDLLVVILKYFFKAFVRHDKKHSAVRLSIGDFFPCDVVVAKIEKACCIWLPKNRSSTVVHGDANVLPRYELLSTFYALAIIHKKNNRLLCTKNR